MTSYVEAFLGINQDNRVDSLSCIQFHILYLGTFWHVQLLVGVDIIALSPPLIWVAPRATLPLGIEEFVVVDS